jgi:ABC-type lipoprotein release transport system permease subunit
VLGQILVRSAGGAVGAVLVGVDPAAELVSSPLPRRMVAGRYLADGDENVVVVGARLAEQLRVGPGKKVVISAGAGGQIVEELARVQGVFSLGAPEVDGYLVQSPLGFGRRMFGLGADQATQIGVVLSDPGRAEAVTERIRQLAGSAVAVRGWQEIMPDVASYIRIGMAWGLLYQSLLLCLILFSVFTTLVVSVMERKREFAVLLALGTPPRLLRLQVFAETALLGLLGCTLGLALGGACAYAAQVHGIDLRRLLPEGMSLSGYTFDLVVRPRPTLPILLWLGGLDYAAVLALSLYPMRLAGRVRPAEQLR